MRRAKTAALWVLQVVPAMIFLLAASGKLARRPGVVDRFRDWGYPDGFYLLIGTLELAGALGLLIPRTAGHAALGLIVVMLGAALTHLFNQEGLQVVRPLVVMVLLVLVVYLRRPWPLKSAPGGSAGLAGGDVNARSSSLV